MVPAHFNFGQVLKTWLHTNDQLWVDNIEKVDIFYSLMFDYLW